MRVQQVVGRGLLAVVPTVLALGAAVGTASAKDGDVKAAGRCSGGSVWKLKAGARDGGIETEFEVDSNVNGQVWSVRISDNGVQVFAGNRTTVAPSGSFSVGRRIADRAGSDSIRATAMNARTGERCSGVVTV
ncbi:MAG: hypothetical protein QOD72_2415 [Acidimicrobiaceae bacterium]|nr:hypothetical protein [Acidimicrobiaceae bacterium]